MFSSVRQKQILHLLDEKREIYVAALAEQLQVSQETIRRDLKLLERRGKLQRVHGGAISATEAALRPVVEREQVERQAKAIIAELAAPLISEGAQIFLGGSSTTLALARLLAADCPRATFVTNMIDIALVLGASGLHQVTLIGGELRPSARTLSGAETLEGIGRRVYDLCFNGVSAIDPELGFLGPTEWHVATHRALRRQSKSTVYLADYSKFGKTDKFCVEALESADLIITDRRPTDEYLAAFEKAGVQARWPE